MKHTDFKTHALSREEKILGSCWLIFQTFFFPTLLQELNKLLPARLPQTELNLVFFCVNFAVVAFVFRRYLWAQIRLVPEILEKVLSVSIAGLIAYWILIFMLIQILLALQPDFTSVNDVSIQELVAEDYTIMFLGSVILAPITEEALYRGLIFRGLYDRNPILARILSVTLFSLIHILNYIGAYPFETLLLCFIQYIPAGICLSEAYRLSGSLLSPILIHALVNLASMLSLR